MRRILGVLTGDVREKADGDWDDLEVDDLLNELEREMQDAANNIAGGWAVDVKVRWNPA